MFVFSMSQFQALMNIGNGTKFDKLLDIGRLVKSSLSKKNLSYIILIFF